MNQPVAGTALRPAAAVRRLARRRLDPLALDYLTYRALWPAIEAAVAQARSGLEADALTANAASTGVHPGSEQSLLVLDVGCGARPYADLFEGMHYVGLDVSTEGARPQVIASALQLPLAKASVDLVFSAQVIEHVADPGGMLAECARVLRPGGALVLSGPFWWPLHEEPHDYFRFTHHGFARLLGGGLFEGVQIVPDCGSLTQAAVAVLELLPRWAAPLRWAINLITPPLQRLSKDRRCTLNHVVLAWRSAQPAD